MLPHIAHYRIEPVLWKTNAWGLTLTMQKDIFTEEYLAQSELNDRQRMAITCMRKQGSMSKREYQELVSVSTRKALYDLTALINKGVLIRIGTGKSSRYSLLSNQKNARNKKHIDGDPDA